MSMLILALIRLPCTQTVIRRHILTFSESNTLQKTFKKFISSKNITTNIYRKQTYDSIMCGYFCIGLIDFMLKGKILTNFANLFSPNNFEDNDKRILKYIRNV